MPIGNGNPDQDVVRAAAAAQQQLKRSQHRDEIAPAVTSTERAQACRQGLGQAPLNTTARLGGLGRTRKIGRQLQHRQLAGQLLAPIGQFLLTGLAGHPLALPERIVGVLHRRD
ncbi:hypothetical protein D3C75_1122510 [compost metagenome]